MSRSDFAEYTDLKNVVISTGALQQNNYVSVAIAVAVMYDLVLSFPNEIEYVWNRPWTLVSFLYVLVRYLGCCCALVSPFYRGTTILSAKTCVPAYSCFHAGSLQCSNRCYALYTLAQFAFLLFLAAADLVMILRVWAMYDRSKTILGILLMVYIPEIVLTTVVAIIASTPGNTQVITVLDRSFCLPGLALYRSLEDTLVFLFPAGLTCILSTIQFVRQTFWTRRTTKGWKLDHYMNLLSRESLIYFLTVLCFGLVNVHNHSISLGVQTWFGFLSAITCVPVFTLTPRFILSLRALYARKLQNGSCCSIDTGFGFSESWSPEGNSMVFADVGDAQGVEGKYMEEERDALSVDEIC